MYLFFAMTIAVTTSIFVGVMCSKFLQGNGKSTARPPVLFVCMTRSDGTEIFLVDSLDLDRIEKQIAEHFGWLVRAEMFDYGKRSREEAYRQLVDNKFLDWDFCSFTPPDSPDVKYTIKLNMAHRGLHVNTDYVGLQLED